MALARHLARRSAVAAACCTLALPVSVALDVAPAWADPTTLCQGAPNGCGIAIHTPGARGTQVTSVQSDQAIDVHLAGNPGVEALVQFYSIEFDAAGAITGLVPGGAPAKVRVSSPTPMIPRATAGTAGGWGFFGLAADTSIDLRSRVGAVVEFGGRTLKLLGDGYAEQKPVGTPLEMWTLGNVKGVGYWVEYLADSGEWLPTPGHGYSSPTRAMTSPGEIAVITYTVPTDLAAGKRYRFRINSHLNFSGGPEQLVADPSYVEWNVVASAGAGDGGDEGDGGGGAGPVPAERGRQFDPNAGPATAPPPPEPSAPPSEEPSPPPSAEPTGAPEPTPPTPSDSPSSGGPDKSTEAPSDSAGQTPPSKAQTPPAKTPPAQTPPEQTPPAQTPPAQTPPPQTPPTPTAQNPTPPPPGPTRSQSRGPSATPGAGSPVWGEEESALTASPVEPASPQVSLAVAGALLAVLAAPVLWWTVRRRERSPGGEDLL